MVRIAALLVIVAVAAAVQPAWASDDPEGGGQGGNTLVWAYGSRVVVNEAVCSIGGGLYRYSYSVVNNDTVGIWHFGVYTTFPVSGVTSFSKSDWSASTSSVTSVHPIYDARNLDPSLAYSVRTWGPSWQPDGISSNPIGVGEAASGFSFVSYSYDPGPKLYKYDIQGNYAVHTGHVAAIGYTAIPEPPGLLAVLCGSVSLLLLRRRS